LESKAKGAVKKSKEAGMGTRKGTQKERKRKM